MIKCDFCHCDLEATRVHRIHGDFIVLASDDMKNGWISPDDWAACDICNALFCQHDIDALVRRSMNPFEFDSPELYQKMSEVFRSIYSSLSPIQ